MDSAVVKKLAMEGLQEYLQSEDYQEILSANRFLAEQFNNIKAEDLIIDEAQPPLKFMRGFYTGNVRTEGKSESQYETQIQTQNFDFTSRSVEIIAKNNKMKNKAVIALMRGLFGRQPSACEAGFVTEHTERADTEFFWEDSVNATKRSVAQLCETQQAKLGFSLTKVTLLRADFTLEQDVTCYPVYVTLKTKGGKAHQQLIGCWIQEDGDESREFFRLNHFEREKEYLSKAEKRKKRLKKIVVIGVIVALALWIGSKFLF